MHYCCAGLDSFFPTPRDSRKDEEKKNRNVMPPLQLIVAKFVDSFRKHKGLIGTLKSCVEEIEDISFDWVFGIRTAVAASDRTLPIISCGIPYAPTKVRRLRKILGELCVNHKEFIFLDVGSGKGRALLVASEFP